MSETKYDLAALQDKELPRASCATVGLHAKNADGEALLIVADAYLRTFVAPDDTTGGKDIDCPGCGRAFGGLFGSFQWDICNGEGFCSLCKYPARAIHRIGDKAESGEYPLTLNRFILAYHPSMLVPSEAVVP